MKAWILFFLLASIANAASSLLPPKLEHLRSQGFDAVFNMNYEDARENFEQMTKADPNHPAGYIYLANTIWLRHLASLRRLQTSLYNRSDAFFSKTEDEVDPKVDKEFNEAMLTGITLAEKRLKADKNDIEALYYLGVAKNITAAYEVSVKRSFFAALRNGSKGTDLHRKVLEKDPTFIDADLSVGMYNYVVGSLPLGVKILVFFGGVHGSKKEGLRTLEKVASQGNYARDEAASLLILLYDREKKFNESLKVLEGLSKKYPNNCIYRLQIGASLAELKRYNESFKVFETLLNDPAAYDYMPDLIHYRYAEALADAGKWQEAYNHYTEAGKSPKAPDGMKTMSYLGLGQCLDVLGKREEAKAEYRLVLKRKEALNSHDLAGGYLKRPFKPE